MWLSSVSSIYEEYLLILQYPYVVCSVPSKFPSLYRSLVPGRSFFGFIKCWVWGLPPKVNSAFRFYLIFRRFQKTSMHSNCCDLRGSLKAAACGDTKRINASDMVDFIQACWFHASGNNSAGLSRATSICLACIDLHQTGHAYSPAVKKMATTEILRNLAWVPQLELISLRMIISASNF